MESAYCQAGEAVRYRLTDGAAILLEERASDDNALIPQRTTTAEHLEHSSTLPPLRYSTKWGIAWSYDWTIGWSRKQVIKRYRSSLVDDTDVWRFWGAVVRYTENQRVID